MLNDKIQRLLIEYEYIPKESPVCFSVRLLGNWGILAYSPPYYYYHIKLDIQHNLQAEFQQLRELYQHYYPFMAKPLDYVVYEDQGFLINQAILHQPMTLNQLKKDNLLQSNINQYFIQSIDFKHSLRDVELDFDLSLFAPQFNTHVDELQLCLTEIQKFAPYPQHGDFVLNNLGVTPDQFLVFDWEDYGIVSLPGFDVMIFLWSLFEFDVSKLYQGLEQNWVQNLLEGFISKSGINVQQLKQFLPLYLCAFLYIKQKFGYSEESVERTQTSISQVFKLKA